MISILFLEKKARPGEKGCFGQAPTVTQQCSESRPGPLHSSSPHLRDLGGHTFAFVLPRGSLIFFPKRSIKKGGRDSLLTLVIQFLFEDKKLKMIFVMLFTEKPSGKPFQGPR